MKEQGGKREHKIEHFKNRIFYFRIKNGVLKTYKSLPRFKWEKIIFKRTQKTKFLRNKILNV